MADADLPTVAGTPGQKSRPHGGWLLKVRQQLGSRAYCFVDAWVHRIPTVRRLVHQQSPVSTPLRYRRYSLNRFILPTILDRNLSKDRRWSSGSTLSTINSASRRTAGTRQASAAPSGVSASCSARRSVLSRQLSTRRRFSSSCIRRDIRLAPHPSSCASS